MTTEGTGAIFSRDGMYRYRLWRYWSGGNGESVCFIMLNPSTADATSNDPTVERCERRARAWGYSGLEVVNIFALRSTDPRALLDHPEPIGPDNDKAILDAAHLARMVICAWGTWGTLHGRGEIVRNMLGDCDLYALRINGDNTPGHPLYLSYLLEPIPY